MTVDMTRKPSVATSPVVIVERANDAGLADLPPRDWRTASHRRPR